MKIHEYQAKAILESAGIPVISGTVADTPAEALEAAKSTGLPVIVKAQVLVGGRGKAGGVKLARTMDEVRLHSSAILGMNIRGLSVRRVLVAKAVEFSQELYVGLIVERRCRKPVLMVSAAGGVEIEEVARQTPERILRQEIDPLLGLRPFQARALGLRLFSDLRQANALAEIAIRLYGVMVNNDCSLVEINPLVILKGTTSETPFAGLSALDAKIVLDDNGLDQHPELSKLRDTQDEEPSEVQARDSGLSYVKLDGKIGCVVNGAGLAMATMDLIKRYGGEPANFLDIGGSSSPEKMAMAMRILLSDRNVRAVLVNVFGGITRCDDVAKGLLQAQEEVGVKVPIVARLIGTNQAEAREILTGTNIIFVDDMSEAVKQVIDESNR